MKKRSNQLMQCALLILLWNSNLFPQNARDSIVNIGKYKLHIRESGIGDPAVIFENGMGEDLSTWKEVQPSIAKLTHTLSYDRAGLGKSDPAPLGQERDAESLAEELHLLLKATQIKGPYILVGHSLGGAIAQIFAYKYPKEVCGLVLVDPGDGRLDRMLQKKLPESIWAARQKELAEEMSKIPVSVRMEFDGLEKSGEEASNAFPLPRIPVFLLTGTKKNPDFPGNPIEQDLKLQLHKELAAHVLGIQHILVPESRHYIQNDAPGKVLSAIEQVLAIIQK